jgi:hypothetical protein
LNRLLNPGAMDGGSPLSRPSLNVWKGKGLQSDNRGPEAWTSPRVWAHCLPSLYWHSPHGVCFGESRSMNLFCLRRPSAIPQRQTGRSGRVAQREHLALNTFSELRKLGPIRQIGAAELMVTLNNFSTAACCCAPSKSAHNWLMRRASHRRPYRTSISR